MSSRTIVLFIPGRKSSCLEEMPNALRTKTTQPEALSGRAQECYEVLLNYRKRRQAEHGEHSESEGTTATFSGSKIARLFSTEAAKNLSAAEWQSLMELLRHRPQNHGVKFLESKVSSFLSEFTAEETSLTGQPGDRLATPPRRADAGLGLIMHIQSKDGAIQGFWDEESPSIQTLAAKGLKPKFIFGFD